MDCDICMIEWDSTNHIPRLLSCGHTFCEVCLNNLLASALNKNTVLYCPTCMLKHKDIQTEKDIKALIKNYNLLRIVEKIESRKSQINLQQSFASERKSKQGDLQINSMINTEKGVNKLEKNNICKLHNLPLLYFNTNNNNLLCETCVKGSNINYAPIPKVIKEMKGKINNTLTKVEIIKHEIERLQDFLTSYQEEFEVSNKKKIDDLFQYLNKIIASNYNSALDILEQCKSEQKTEIDGVFSELSELQKEILKIENELSFSFNNDEKNMPQYVRKVNKIWDQLNNLLNYEMELNLLAMKIGLKEEFKNKIFNWFQETYSIDVEFATINGEEAPTVKHILQKQNFWVCFCGEFNNPFTTVRCLNCERMIKTEIIPNILDNPLQVTIRLKKTTSSNIDLLIIRRKEECKEFHQKFNNKSLNEKQYIIDIDWFLNWKCFVTNDLTEKFLPNNKKIISINDKIGVLPPGPISNHYLLDNQKNLKKNLINNQDFILVNESLWKFFQKNYEGGPELLWKIELSPKKTKHFSQDEIIKPNMFSEEKKPLNRQYSTINDKNRIVMKKDYQNYIQETKFEPLETESIRNDECTFISEGNINEVYSNNYNSNAHYIRKQIISERVEIEFPHKMKNIMHITNRNNIPIKNKK